MPMPLYADVVDIIQYLQGIPRNPHSGTTRTQTWPFCTTSASRRKPSTIMPALGPCMMRCQSMWFLRACVQIHLCQKTSERSECIISEVLPFHLFLSWVCMGLSCLLARSLACCPACYSSRYLFVHAVLIDVTVQPALAAASFVVRSAKTHCRS